jgi:hypothetical protein
LALHESRYLWNTGDSVKEAECDFLTAIVDRFEHHLHLVWVIAEECAEQLSTPAIIHLHS